MSKKEMVIDVFVEIRCPACHRKLMEIRVDNKVALLVELLTKEKDRQYTAETRCPSCKVYVGIIS
jgi:uncharacterized protein with PIN domain